MDGIPEAPAPDALADLDPTVWTAPAEQLTPPEALGPLDRRAILWVRDADAVRRCAEAVAQSKVVALDTEADSLHHYQEKTCLIQVGTPERAWLVDPLCPIDLRPLFAALAEVPMILFHGADYDVRMLRRDFGFQPGAVFDTMLAAQLLGYERISYAALVEKFLGVVIDKKSQKADWSIRPLTPVMEEYAAGDVYYLPSVARCLMEELREAGRAAWHRECCEWTVRQASLPPTEPDEDRRWRVKGWNSLKHPRAQAILREVWRWRDDEARRADLPGFKILRNETLVELAAYYHMDPAERGDQPEPRLPRSYVGRRRRALDEAIQTGLSLAPAQWPGPVDTPRPDRPPADENMVAALRGVRDRFAEQLKIDPGILFPSASIAALAATRPTTVAALRDAGILYDWQIDVLGESILRVIATTPLSTGRPQRRRR